MALLCCFVGQLCRFANLYQMYPLGSFHHAAHKNSLQSIKNACLLMCIHALLRFLFRHVGLCFMSSIMTGPWNGQNTNNSFFISLLSIVLHFHMLCVVCREVAF